MNHFNASGEIRTVLTAVLIVFIPLKLTGEIAWPWWWVLAPMWAPTLAVLALFAVFLVAGTVASHRPEDEQ